MILDLTEINFQEIRKLLKQFQGEVSDFLSINELEYTFRF